MRISATRYLPVMACILLQGIVFGQGEKDAPKPKLDSYSHILKAGEASDRSLIPQLQEIFRSKQWDGRYGLYGRSAAAQMALARVGDETAMKSILCELRNDQLLDAQNHAFLKLKYVGGYTTIRILSRFLDNSEANTKERFYPGSDGTFGRLGEQARDTLEAITHPPFLLPPAAGAQEAGENKLWLQWLREHDAEFNTKQPIFSFEDVTAKECKQINLELGRP